MAICLVCGRNFGALASSRAPLLSSNTLHLTEGTRDGRRMPQLLSSSKSCMTKMTSQRAVERAMYSASVIERAMMGWSLEAQTMGQFANIIKNPVRDRHEVASLEVSGE